GEDGGDGDSQGGRRPAPEPGGERGERGNHGTSPKREARKPRCGDAAAGPLDRVGQLGVEGRSEGDGTGRRVVTERAGEALLREGEDAAVGRHHQVAVAV